MKIIIAAASEDNMPGWVKTRQAQLDILIPDTWEAFLADRTVNAIMIEHVLEHFYLADARKAAELCYRYLASCGHVRVAVPDGYHPDFNYINDVRPGGNGAGTKDHKILYTYRTLSKIFEDCGFHVKLLEYWDECGNFHFRSWDISDGKIRRSKRFDWRNTDNTPLAYTSLILDAIK